MAVGRQCLFRVQCSCNLAVYKIVQSNDLSVLREKNSSSLKVTSYHSNGLLLFLPAAVAASLCKPR